MIFLLTWGSSHCTHMRPLCDAKFKPSDFIPIQFTPAQVKPIKLDF